LTGDIRNMEDLDVKVTLAGFEPKYLKLTSN
jgi:hypothetical protein